MVYKRFGIRVFLQALLITATSLVCAWALLHKLYLTFSFAGIILILESAWLIYYVQRTNHELSKLLLAIKYSDFSQHFSTTGPKDSFRELYGSFNEILAAFKKARLEKEEQFHYLQKVVEHVGICLIAFDETGKVEIYNRAVKETFGIPYLRHIDDLDRVQPELKKLLLSLEQGQQETITLNSDTGSKILSFRVEDFIVGKLRLRLASIQDIRSELEQKEVETWQKMIRVLTHEIMNSVTPITSLASVTIGFLEKDGSPKNITELSNENMEDALNGLYTIRKRSEGLTNFVQRYRSLMRLPQPRLPQEVKIKELFNRVSRLLASDFINENVLLQIQQVPEHLSLQADPELLEQVLINLLKNSLQATAGKNAGRVTLSAVSAENESGKVLLKVTDNGSGIPDEAKDKIFIPFFTTKGGGSGIGLSLSQQIIRAHNGNINVYSKEGEGTTVVVSV